MRWIKILLICLLGSLAMIGGGVAFLWTLDPNEYKDEISTLVRGATGRALELDGRVDLDLGAHTTLEITDARFGNPDWAANPYMARLSRAKLVVDVMSILKGPIVIERFEIEDAELHLEANEDELDNWTFGAPPDPDATDDDDTGPIPLVLRDIEAQDFLFTLSLPALPQKLEVHAEALKQQQNDDGMLDAVGTGTLNKRKISIGGLYGPLTNLLNATDLRLDVKGEFDTLSISGDGVIDDLAWPRRPTINLTFAGASIDDVTDMLGLPDLGDGGLDLRATVTPNADGVKTDIAGNIGEYVTDTKVSARELLEFERLALETDIKGPSLSKAMQIFGVDGIPAGPFEVNGNLKRDANRVDIDSLRLSIGTAVFDLQGAINDIRSLNDAKLKLQVAGNDVEQFRELFGVPGAATGPFQINADLNTRPDGVELLEVHMRTNIASMRIDGQIAGTAPDFIGTRLAFAGTGRNLADFTDIYDIPNVIAEPFSIKGAIELGDGQLASTAPVTVKVAEDTLTVEGTMGYAPLEAGTAINARAMGGDLAAIAAMAGVTERVPELAYDVRTGLTIDADGYRFSKLKAKVGDNDIELDGLVSKRRDLRGSRATFAASGPNLNDLLADTMALDLTEGPYAVSGRAELLADSIRLEQIEATLADGSAKLDAKISLPLESATGHFDASAKGPNLRAVLPPRPRWDPPERPFELRANGTLADGLWSFDELSARVGTARLTGTGQFDQPPDLSRTNLAVNAVIPSLAVLGAIDDRPLPTTNVTFDLAFAGSPESFRIDPFTAVIGGGDLSGKLSVKLDNPVPEIDLKIDSRTLNFDELWQLDAPRRRDRESAQKDSPAASGDGRIVPAAPLPLEQLERLNARVDIDVANLVFNRIRYRDLVVDGELRDGRLVLEKVSAITERGDLNLSASLVSSDGMAEVKTKINGQGIYLGLDTRLTPEDRAKAPAFDADIELAGVGSTLREVASSLDGRVFLLANGGRFKNSTVGFLFGDFLTELLTTLNPFIKKEPYTRISCIVVLLDIADGVIAVDPGFVAQTDKINMIATGRVNLNDERLNMDFKTQPRSRMSLSAGEFINPYLKVTGKLAKPRLTLDPTGTIVTGGAAIATAGLSLLATAAWDRVFRADDPCAAAIAESMKDGKKRKKFLGVF